MRSVPATGLLMGLVLLCAPERASAQDISALLSTSGSTMQDIENGALRNAIRRASTGLDAAPTSGPQGNVFLGLQQGNDNRIDATQTGVGNVIQISQVGNWQNAVIAQSGSNNRIVLRQGR